MTDNVFLMEWLETLAKKARQESQEFEDRAAATDLPDPERVPLMMCAANRHGRAQAYEAAAIKLRRIETAYTDPQALTEYRRIRTLKKFDIIGAVVSRRRGEVTRYFFPDGSVLRIEWGKNKCSISKGGVWISKDNGLFLPLEPQKPIPTE